MINFLKIFYLLLNQLLIINTQICYDIDQNSYIRLECISSANFYFKPNTPITQAYNPNPDKYSLQTIISENKKYLNITKIDKYDSGNGTYYALIDGETIPYCIYDIQVFNKERLHSGFFSIYNSTVQELSSSITDQFEIPIFKVDNPYNFNINITYQIKALLINKLIITVNNKNLTFNKTCYDDNPSYDCLEANNAIININRESKENECQNNFIELILDYNLTNRLNCDVSKLQPFKYNFGINYDVTLVTLKSNLVDDNKISLNELGIFNCSVECANPNNFHYVWTIITSNEIQDDIQNSYTSKYSNILFYSFQNKFDKSKIKCCVSNSINIYKCAELEIYFNEEVNVDKTNLSSGAIIGIAIGCFFVGISLTLIISFIYVIKLKKSILKDEIKSMPKVVDKDETLRKHSKQEFFTGILSNKPTTLYSDF